MNSIITVVSIGLLSVVCVSTSDGHKHKNYSGVSKLSTEPDKADDSFEFDKVAVEEADLLQSKDEEGSGDDSEASGDSQPGSIAQATAIPPIFASTIYSSDLTAQLLEHNKTLLSNEQTATLLIVLASVGATVGILLIVAAVLFMVYRCRKRDEGSYTVDPKRRKWEKGYRRAMMTGESDVFDV